jgi:hypothetical protein
MIKNIQVIATYLLGASISQLILWDEDKFWFMLGQSLILFALAGIWYAIEKYRLNQNK